jgi:polysaccharide export outer membrane protein
MLSMKHCAGLGLALRHALARSRSSSAGVVLLALTVWLPALTGCSYFPSSGPTAAQIEDSVEAAKQSGLKIVEITPEVLKILAEVPPAAPESIPEPSTMPWSDLIGVGDTLSVIILESGPGLFSPASSGSSSATFSLLVNLQGDILVPYAGRIPVAGHTPLEAATQIEYALRGKAVQPQVVISITGNRSNTVFVAGDIKSPGRYPLSPKGERLMDILTLAGGPTQPIAEVTVHFGREERLSVFPLSKVTPYSAENVALAPGDQITLIGRPRSILVFGASGKVAELPFNAPTVNMAQAVARAAGPSDPQADPTGVYLFRFEDAKIARALDLPQQDNARVIYHLDLLDAVSYFDMTAFEMRDKDLIYIANARINAVQKFMGLVSTLFTPVLVGKTVAGD